MENKNTDKQECKTKEENLPFPKLIFSDNAIFKGIHLISVSGLLEMRSIEDLEQVHADSVVFGALIQHLSKEEHINEGLKRLPDILLKMSNSYCKHHKICTVLSALHN